MPVLERGDAGIAFAVHGDGPPVLLTHGFALDSRMWAPQLGPLGRGNTLVTWDMRGHGARAAQRKGWHAAALLAAGALALAGCGLGGPSVPAEVERLVEARFPADGQVHVQARGKFVVTEQTVFCRAPRNIAVSLKDAAPTFYNPGIDDVENAELGEVVHGKPCANDGINLINHWALVPNRDGEPYKLVLAVWQGDPANGGALWVGGVERIGKLPLALPGPTDTLPTPDDLKVPLPSKSEMEASHKRRLTAWNVEHDIPTISDQFIEHLQGAGEPQAPAR
jgi:hypothetical protein